MLLNYIILGLSVSFTPLVSARPFGPIPELDHLPGLSSIPLVPASSEPGSLLGRQYSVQDRRQDISPDLLVASRPEANSANAPRRLVPYAKFLADRSDDSWLHMRKRRADDADGNVNYLSNVSAYSAPKPFAAPAPPPPPPVAIPPPPTVTPPVFATTALPRPAVTPKPNKDAQKKHSSKTKMTKVVKAKAREEGVLAREEQELA